MPPPPPPPPLGLSHHLASSACFSNSSRKTSSPSSNGGVQQVNNGNINRSVQLPSPSLPSFINAPYHSSNIMDSYGVPDDVQAASHMLTTPYLSSNNSVSSFFFPSTNLGSISNTVFSTASSPTNPSLSSMYHAAAMASYIPQLSSSSGGRND